MKLADVFKESFNVAPSELKDDVKLVSFGEWDSLTHMFFITKLEEAYEIELTGDEIADMQTVGDVKKIIASKGKLV
jgi:acyl carrier protein